MGWQGVRYGPTGSRGIVGLTRGSIRQGRWLVPGMTRPHEMVIDCGRFGRGPMHVTVDKLPALTFPKPTVEHPAVISEERLVDGLRLAVYAESRDGGNTIDCDVFVDGGSLLTGQPVQNVSGWGEQAVRAAGEKRRTGPLDSVPLLFVIAFGTAGMRTFATILNRPNPRLHPVLLIAGVAAIYAILFAIGYWAFVRLRRRPGLTRRGSILGAFLLVAGEFVAIMATVIVAVLLTA